MSLYLTRHTDANDTRAHSGAVSKVISARESTQCDQALRLKASGELRLRCEWFASMTFTGAPEEGWTMRHTRVGWLFRGLLALGLVVAITSRANAFLANEIDACGQKCQATCPGGPNATCRTAISGKCILTHSFSCPATGTGSGSILINIAATLDLSGYSITCSDPTSCPYIAISVNSTGGKVTNSAGAESIVSGPFDTIIDCGGNATTSVTNVTVRDGLFGINNCRTVTNNVVGPTSQSFLGANQGISSLGISNSDTISNNSVSGRTLAIYHQSSFNVTIAGNVIDTSSATDAVTLGGSGNVNANGNIFFGTGYNSGSQLFFTTGYTGSLTPLSNYCDPNHPDCAACITALNCQAYATPSFPGN
jgi:hypothetical protein